MSFGVVLRALLVVLLLAGCHSAPPDPTPTPALSESLLQQAEELLKAADYEGAALTFRDALDQMEQSGAAESEIRQVQEKATHAMVEAGGNARSQRVWEEMGRKNPESKMEAGRMRVRAERLMLQQGEELLVQATEDFKQGHLSKAVATARATETLFTLAGADDEQKKRLTDFFEQLEK